MLCRRSVSRQDLGKIILKYRNTEFWQRNWYTASVFVKNKRIKRLHCILYGDGMDIMN